jgi:hypothetical protein
MHNAIAWRIDNFTGRQRQATAAGSLVQQDA